MVVQAVLSVKNCVRCRHYEARDMLPKMVTIGATEPMDLVHIDFVGMETTLRMRKTPVIKTMLIVIDHFTRFVRAYVVDNRKAEDSSKDSVQPILFSVWISPPAHVGQCP